MHTLSSISISPTDPMNSERNDGTSAPDRLSDLPQHIVHHILSSLPTKDVAKLSFLSKTFASTSSSYPVLDFDYQLTNMPEDKFLSYVNSTIQRRSRQEGDDNVLKKFRFSLEGGWEFPDHCIDGAISYAVRNNVKDLVLVSVGGGYPLPATVFSKSVTRLTLSCFRVKNLTELIMGSPQLEKLNLAYCSVSEDFKFSSNKIKSIDLEYCVGMKSIEIESSSLESFRYTRMSAFVGKLGSFDISNCGFLKLLSLENAQITDNWIETLFPRLPLLETVELSCCHEFSIFKVSNYNLTKISLICCKKLERIEVRVENIESFEYVGFDTRYSSSAAASICDIDISACKHLKNLTLNGKGIPKGVLEEQVPKLLELDSLELDVSSFSKRIEINHESLKKLDIHNPTEHLDGREIKIHAPGLVSFRYRCKVIPFLSFHSQTALEATVNILPDWKLDTNYFLRWYEFIRFFCGCKVLTIVCTNDKELIFPHDLREKMTSPLIDLKHMRIQLPRVSVELVDSLLWLSPYLETLDFLCPESEETLMSIKFEYGIPINKEGGHALCSSNIQTEYYSVDGFEEKDNLLKLFKERANLRSIS